MLGEPVKRREDCLIGEVADHPDVTIGGRRGTLVCNLVPSAEKSAATGRPNERIRAGILQEPSAAPFLPFPARLASMFDQCVLRSKALDIGTWRRGSATLRRALQIGHPPSDLQLRFCALSLR
jgi:hypothetical protein